MLAEYIKNGEIVNLSALDTFSSIASSILAGQK